MVAIAVDEENKCLNFKATGDNFSECIEDFRNLHLQYIPETKVWRGDIGLYSKYIDELSLLGLSIDEYTKDYVKKWQENICELTIINKRSEYRKFIPDLMKFMPIRK